MNQLIRSYCIVFLSVVINYSNIYNQNDGILYSDAWMINSFPTTAISHRQTFHISVIVDQTTQKHKYPMSSSLNAIGNNKYNVVLEPSYDDPIAFDSYKIGSAKVHRYSRDKMDSITNTIIDADTEYVMWYHGRSNELQQQSDLPPLSTGRIGRAISRNGLVWKKQKIGSESEDKSDVCLGLNKESWWFFDTTHVGLGTVLLPMSTPAVMTDSGVYLLYYMGGNGEENLLADYLDNNNIPDSMKEKKVMGIKTRIGVALSQDGISFGRVEGDDPSGACLIPQDNLNGTGYKELYCGWPEVIVNIDGIPSELYRMYYSTMIKNNNNINDNKLQKCIAYATSSDGFRWFQQGVCIAPNNDNMDNIINDYNGCARCSVTKDAEYNIEKGIWNELPSFTMYYEGISSSDNKHRIFKATSKDGKTYIKQGLAFNVGSTTTDSDNDVASDWDCIGVGSPHIIRLDDGSSRMYYTGQSVDGSTAIGVAKDQEGSGIWMREQATIAFITA